MSWLRGPKEYRELKKSMKRERYVDSQNNQSDSFDSFQPPNACRSKHNERYADYRQKEHKECQTTILEETTVQHSDSENSSVKLENLPDKFSPNEFSGNDYQD